MWLGVVLVIMGVGSSAAAAMHWRKMRRGEPVYYPLLYDLLGAAGFLLFGVGTLLKVGLLIGRARLWLLLLLPIAIDKWRRTLTGRSRGHSVRK
jgi:hypothetical protein